MPNSSRKGLEGGFQGRSEEHTSELQSHLNLVCRLLLEKKKQESPFSAHQIPQPRLRLQTSLQLRAPPALVSPRRTPRPQGTTVLPQPTRGLLLRSRTQR